jgi:fructose-1-phosphate kinase PfkB-like protein
MGYRDTVDLAHRYHVPVIADLHGEQLRMILGQKPWLIKPSLTEFDELIGHETSDLPERARLSASICRETGVIIALSMSAEGLLVTAPDGQWLLKPPSVECRLPDGLGINVIGCGDALVGALSFEYCETRDLLSAARLGMAAAYSNLRTLGVPEIDAKDARWLAPLVDVQTYKDEQDT